MPIAGGVIAYLIANNAPQVSEQTSTVQPLPPAALPVERPKALEIAPIPQPLGETMEFVVRCNDTFDRIFRQLKLDLNDLANIRQLPGIKDQLDRLRRRAIVFNQ